MKPRHVISIGTCTGTRRTRQGAERESRGGRDGREASLESPPVDFLRGNRSRGGRDRSGPRFRVARARVWKRGKRTGARCGGHETQGVSVVAGALAPGSLSRPAGKQSKLYRIAAERPIAAHLPADGGHSFDRGPVGWMRSEEHTSELQSRGHLVCRLLLEKKKKKKI